MEPNLFLKQNDSWTIITFDLEPFGMHFVDWKENVLDLATQKA